MFYPQFKHRMNPFGESLSEQTALKVKPHHQLSDCPFGWRPNSLANMCLSISRSPDDAVMLSGLKIHVQTKGQQCVLNKT